MDSQTTRVLFEHLSAYKDNPSLSDVIVIAGNTEFHCHRLLLAAVSEFFAAAFRSDMKEAREGKITLGNVDKKVFSTFLTCIYNGKYVLTEDNLFEIWALADQLQINFLLLQCEQLFDELLTVENCVEFVDKVRHFSAKAKSLGLKHIAENFLHLQVKANIYKLNLDELKFVVSSRELIVDSEDDVVEAIFEWNYEQLNSPDFIPPDSVASSDSDIAECQNKDQQLSSPDFLPLDTVTSTDSGIEECQDKDHQLNSPDFLPPESAASTECQNKKKVSVHEQRLTEILECTRYLLASKSCFYRTSAYHALSREGLNLRDILSKISDYLSQPHLHQTWCPPAALHRDNSEMVNVLLSCKTPRNGKLKVLNPQNMEWGELLIPSSVSMNRSIRQVVCHNSKLYIFRDDEKVHTHYGGISKWHWVTFSHLGLFCDINDSLYICEETENGKVSIFKLSNISRMFDKDSNKYRFLGGLNTRNEKCKIANFTSIDNNMLLLFYQDKESNSYVIQSYSLTGTVFQNHHSKLGSSSRLVTFRHNNEVFALQENGCLWRVKPSPDSLLLKITQELALWDGEISLNGAVLYNNQLMIVGDFSTQTEASETLHISLSGVFEKVTKVLCPETERGGSDPSGVILAAIPKNFTSLSFSDPTAETQVTNFYSSTRRGSTIDLSSLVRPSQY